jgi:hypothetical protein
VLHGLERARGAVRAGDEQTVTLAAQAIQSRPSARADTCGRERATGKCPRTATVAIEPHSLGVGIGDIDASGADATAQRRVPVVFS